jgi:hypothetical protein
MADRFLVAALLVVLALLIMGDATPKQALPLIQADYTRCVTLHSDLERKPAHNYDYRVARGHVNGGLV